MFAFGVWVKNTLYDRRILKSRVLVRPVVSVGNISVGGSGKTPFIITLGRLLKERGIEFDVLSRGYGRKSTEVLVVERDGPVERFGDEPLLIARKLGVPVIVGAERYKAGLLAEKMFPQSRLHLLDDGFQHRRLHRDLDIILLRPDDFTDALLPIGRLREGISALRRADIIVAHPSVSQVVHRFGKPIWEVRARVQIAPQTNALVAFCGIARPQRFYAELEKSGINVSDSFTFADHHRYTQGDIDRLLQAQARTGAAGFITTEKDAVNLDRFAGQLHNLETAELHMELENAPEAVESLLRLLANRCGFEF